MGPYIKREINLSAYLGNDSVYHHNSGDAVNKVALLSGFKQIAAIFGYRLTGQLVDATESGNTNDDDS